MKTKTLFTGTAFANKVKRRIEEMKQQGNLTDAYLDGDAGPKVYIGKQPSFILHEFDFDGEKVFVGSDIQ